MALSEKGQDKGVRRTVSRAIGFGGLIIVVTLIHLWQTRDLVEGSVPALSGQTLQGAWFNLNSQSQWPLLIHFWADWCPVCKLERSGIESLSKDYPVVTVAMRSGSDSDVMRLIEQDRLRFPVINDPQGRIASAWRVYGVPTSYIVGRDGKVIFTSVGYTFPMTLRLRLWLAEIW
jgi:thiol-disulfide isomerase/thioredoxin